MIAEIISIGDELLIGQTINTNAAYIGESLSILGFTVKFVTAVGDTGDDITMALDTAIKRSALVMITGGLGPTHDDITKNVISGFFQRELVRFDDIFQSIVDRYRKLDRVMPAFVENQALYPRDTQLFHNRVGSARGMLFETSGIKVIVMPGVPGEMKTMMDEEILPYIKSVFPVGNRVMRTIKTLGLFESDIVEKLDNLQDILGEASLAILPGFSGVQLRLTVDGLPRDRALSVLNRLSEGVERRLGPWIYGGEKDTVEDLVFQLLRENNLTLATAESCTGGLIASKITDFPGSSTCFERGVITYSNRSKTDLLGVSKAMIEEMGAVSESVALAMAEGVRKMAGTDFGLSTTGIAGPDGGTPDKPVGLVYIAVSGPRGNRVERYILTRDRMKNKERFACAALNLLRKQLVEYNQAEFD